MTVDGVISGREYHVDEEEARRLLAQLDPEPVRDHYVVVGGRRLPPKQAVSALLDLDRADFTTYQARRVLQRLGFVVSRYREPPRSAPPASRPEPEPPRVRPASPSADALRDYVGQWVAVRDGEVVASGASPETVLRALARADARADSMFRVPLDPARDLLGG